MATRWWMLFVIVLVRLAMGYQFQTIASSSTHLVENFALSYAEIGTLIGFLLLPGIVFSVPSGLVTRALADRTLLLIGCMVMIAGSLVIGLGESVSALYTGRLLSGIGGAISTVILTKMVTDWFAGYRMITAMAIMSAAWPGGVGLGLVSQGQIADIWGWPWVMHAASLVSGFAFVLTVLFYRDAERPESGNGQIRFGLPYREFVHMSIVGLSWTMLNACLILIVSYTPDHLIAGGYDPETARRITSMVLWIGIFAIPLSGRVVEHFGLVTSSIVLSMAATGLLMLLLAGNMFPQFMVPAIAVAFSISVGSAMSLSAQAVRSVNRGPGLGIFYTWNYIGMATAPVLAGWSRDLTGDTAAPILLSALLAFGVLGATLLFRLLQIAWPIPAEET